MSGACLQWRGAIISHGLTDAMSEEPRAFVGNADHPVQLMSGHAFLAGVHQMNGKQPLVNRNMAALHDGAGAAGELVAAVIAKEITRLGLARHAADVCGTTERAIGAIGPTAGLQMGNGSGFFSELGGGDIGHGANSRFQAGL